MKGAAAEIHRETRIAELFLARARAAGKALAPLLRRFRLPAEVGSGESILLPLSGFRELSDAVAELVGDPELGATTALGAQRGDYGLWEYVARNEETLGEALRGFVEHRSRGDPHLRYSLTLEGDEAIYRFHVPGQRLGLGRHGNEFSLLMLKRLATDYADGELRLRRAWFCHPKPAAHPRLTEGLGVEPTFDAGENGMAFDARLLELPVHAADPALRSLLTRQLEARLASTAQGASLPALVEGQVVALLERGEKPAVERVAEALRMSGRTLQRRLTDHQTSFLRVVDEARKRLAWQEVTAGKRTLGEIAFLLGYAEVTPFARAFKRWTGRTPQEVRKAGG